MLFQPLHSEVARQLRREHARDLERRFRAREAGAAALGLRAARARKSAPAPSQPVGEPVAEYSEGGARR
jgi:hypothetical protein